MSEADQSTILHLVKIIMSSKSAEEQQREALQCLKATPDLLLSLLTRSCNDDETARPSNMNINNNNSRSRQPSHSNDADIKRRKSKYSDIHGDLSHLRRDPKRKNEKQDTNRNKKRQKHSQQCDKEKDQIEVSFDDGVDERHNIHLVRKLIEMLRCPTSRQHQESIVALLRADDNLRRLFLKEKAKLGKQIVPVFRRSTSRDDSQILCGVNMDENPSDKVQIGSQVHINAHESTLVRAHISSNGPELVQNEDLRISDALLSSLIIALKTDDAEKREENQDNDTSSPMKITDFRLPGSDLNELQNDCSTMDGAINVTTDGCNIIGDQQFADSTSNSFPNGQIEVVSSFEYHQIISDNCSGLNSIVFDTSLHEDFQELSQELYNANNIQPNAFYP